MSLPNLLTFFRLFLVIPFVITLMNPDPYFIITSFFIYIFASITDYFDGYLARKLRQTTKLGAFLDPLADKILLISAFAIFSLKKYIFLPFYLVIILVFRDYFITLLRIEVDKQKGKKNSDKKRFKTSYTAKFKTAFQMITIIIFYIIYLINIKFFKIKFTNNFINKTILYLPLIFFSTSLILSYYSAFKYTIKYKNESFLTLVKTISTFFYLGYLTKFPGTFVSFIAILLLFLIKIKFITYIFLLILIVIIGTITSEITSRKENVKDPGYVTIDEIAGIVLSIFPFYFFSFININFNNNNSTFIFNFLYTKKWIFFAISFILFRFFDIVKPLGINKIQKIRGGIGIMIDDILAGIYTLVIIGALCFV